jgi:nucleoside-diphosphate-sugar epimerase
MRYFLTGATGFIGERVAQQLLAAGHEVITLARTRANSHKLEAMGYEAYEGDITNRESLRAPMSGVDGVFHMAAWYKIGVKDKIPAEQINVGGTRNVLELMKELHIPRGVYTSTLAVFSDTKGRLVDETYRYHGSFLSEYDRTKWKAHYEVAEPMMQAGLPLIIVMPGLVYGPGDTSPVHETFVHYLRHQLPMVPSQTAFCWSHVDDTARGIILAMEKGRPGESYIIAGPNHTLDEVFEIAAPITGIHAPRLHPGPGVMRAMAAFMEVIGAVARLPERYTAESLRTTAGVTYIGSNEKAKRELGFQPRSLEEGLRETLQYEQKHLDDPKFTTKYTKGI